MAAPKVKVILNSAQKLATVLKPQSIDVIFMSNFLEHLDTKDDVSNILYDAYKVLNSGGRLLIMQPDIRLVGSSYWDFFDHKVPITYQSLREILEAIGFKIIYYRYPFLPYTTKLKLIPLNPLLLYFYIKLRPLHFIFGKQFFICAKKI